METKRCKKCGEVKPLDQFSMDKRWGTTRGACRECENIEAKRRVYARRATQEGKDARRLEVQRRIDSGWQERYKERRNRMNWEARMIVEGDAYDEKLVKMYRDAIDECNEMMSKIKKNKTLDRIDTILDSFELFGDTLFILDHKRICSALRQSKGDGARSIIYKLKYICDNRFRQMQIMKGGNRKRRERLTRDGSVTKELIAKKLSVKSCPVCGKIMKESDKCIDHIKPIAKGGLHTASNLICICRSCNAKKAAKDLDKFIDEIPVKRKTSVLKAYARASQLDIMV